MNNASPFKWRHFEAEIILLCVRWYLRYSLSYRDWEEMMMERGLHVDHSTISRWVKEYAPEWEKRCRPHLNACNDSWKVDETSITVRNVWMYLYRAVDAQGNTRAFLLRPTRDAKSAKRFFVKAVPSSARSTSGACPMREMETAPSLPMALLAQELVLRVINTEKNAAYPKAITDVKAAGILPEKVELRQVKYLGNLIEQDHRFIKRLTKPGMGFFSFETAWQTLQGFEIRNMRRKGQVQGVDKGEVRGQVALVAQLFGVAV
jgi:transposase-like protein